MVPGRSPKALTWPPYRRYGPCPPMGLFLWFLLSFLYASPMLPLCFSYALSYGPLCPFLWSPMPFLWSPILSLSSQCRAQSLLVSPYALSHSPTAFPKRFPMRSSTFQTGFLSSSPRSARISSPNPHVLSGSALNSLEISARRRRIDAAETSLDRPRAGACAEENVRPRRQQQRGRRPGRRRRRRAPFVGDHQKQKKSQRRDSNPRPSDQLLSHIK